MTAATTVYPQTAAEWEALGKLSKDLREAASTLGDDEARFLVDLYYQIQEARKRSANQKRAMGESAEPNRVIDWVFSVMRTTENSIKYALGKYAQNHPAGRWAMSQYGIGPVLTAGLLAHIDISKAPTVGHIWSFAGISTHQEWKKGQKRPWNARLKTLCWKIGQSFMKFHGRDDCFYGKLYAERKVDEIDRNRSGVNVHTAQETLKQKNIGKTTDAYKWYSGRVTTEAYAEYLQARAAGVVQPKLKLVDEGKGLPMLPPAHIDARARRWAVKLFLSHLHHVWYESENGTEPAKPYVIEHLGHAHYVAPPGWPMES